MTHKELFAQPRTINDYWKAFEALVGLDKPDVSEIQRKESKRVFFAAFDLARCAFLSVVDLPEEEAMKQFTSWQKQADGFALAVKMGEA